MPTLAVFLFISVQNTHTCCVLFISVQNTHLRTHSPKMHHTQRSHTHHRIQYTMCTQPPPAPFTPQSLLLCTLQRHLSRAHATRDPGNAPGTRRTGPQEHGRRPSGPLSLPDTASGGRLGGCAALSAHAGCPAGPPRCRRGRRSWHGTADGAGGAHGSAASDAKACAHVAGGASCDDGDDACIVLMTVNVRHVTCNQHVCLGTKKHTRTILHITNSPQYYFTTIVRTTTPSIHHLTTGGF